MRIINNYSTSYVGSSSRLETLKYELSNEYGYNLDGRKNHITEEQLVKKVCDHKSDKK